MATPALCLYANAGATSLPALSKSIRIFRIPPTII
jgi:hypothetical protein